MIHHDRLFTNTKEENDNKDFVEEKLLVFEELLVEMGEYLKKEDLELEYILIHNRDLKNHL